jgi:hypothetical protein
MGRRPSWFGVGRRRWGESVGVRQGSSRPAGWAWIGQVVDVRVDEDLVGQLVGRWSACDVRGGRGAKSKGQWDGEEGHRVGRGFLKAVRAAASEGRVNGLRARLDWARSVGRACPTRGRPPGRPGKGELSMTRPRHAAERACCKPGQARARCLSWHREDVTLGELSRTARRGAFIGRRATRSLRQAGPTPPAPLSHSSVLASKGETTALKENHLSQCQYPCMTG